MKSLAHEIRGLPVHASDGEIGTVKDVVFETASWTIHFLEVDTGWLFGRDVLVPTEKIVRVELPEKGVTFALTKKQIEDSPRASEARPVEHDFDALFPYFGVAVPWSAEVVAPPRDPEPQPPVDPSRRLIFGRDIQGYELDARGEEAGTVRDIAVDLEKRKVVSISADVGGLIDEDIAEVGLGPVTEIDTEKRVVRVNLPKDKVDTSHRLSPEDLPYVFPYIPPIL